METGKTGKYIKYAIGEIILVVIGILIALQINNWNQQRADHNKLMAIYDIILTDIDNDIQELSENRRYYKDLEYIFKRVIHDSITPDLFDVGLSRILTSNNDFTNLNKTGVNQLKELNNKDSLSLRIIEIYDVMENLMINDIEARMKTESTEMVNMFRDKYDWYPEYMSKKIMKDNSSKELQDYFLHSSEYRHRVISNYQLRYNNYVRFLDTSIPKLEAIAEDIKDKLGKETI